MSEIPLPDDYEDWEWSDLNDEFSEMVSKRKENLESEKRLRELEVVKTLSESLVSVPSWYRWGFWLLLGYAAYVTLTLLL